MVKVRPPEAPEIHKVLQGESLVQNSVGYMHMIRSHTIFSPRSIGEYTTPRLVQWNELPPFAATSLGRYPSFLNNIAAPVYLSRWMRSARPEASTSAKRMLARSQPSLNLTWPTFWSPAAVFSQAVIRPSGSKQRISARPSPLECSSDINPICTVLVIHTRYRQAACRGRRCQRPIPGYSWHFPTSRPGY